LTGRLDRDVGAGLGSALHDVFLSAYGSVFDRAGPTFEM
jgi:hypothetical protein